jgi:hypothetical protein
MANLPNLKKEKIHFYIPDHPGSTRRLGTTPPADRNQTLGCEMTNGAMISISISFMHITIYKFYAKNGICVKFI